MLCVDRDSFNCVSFLTRCPQFFFSYLATLLRTFSTLLLKENKHLSLIPDLSRKNFHLSSLSMISFFNRCSQKVFVGSSRDSLFIYIYEYILRKMLANIHWSTPCIFNMKENLGDVSKSVLKEFPH